MPSFPDGYPRPGRRTAVTRSTWITPIRLSDLFRATTPASNSSSAWGSAVPGVGCRSHRRCPDYDPRHSGWE